MIAFTESSGKVGPTITSIRLIAARCQGSRSRLPTYWAMLEVIELFYTSIIVRAQTTTLKYFFKEFLVAIHFAVPIGVDAHVPIMCSWPRVFLFYLFGIFVQEKSSFLVLMALGDLGARLAKQTPPAPGSENQWLTAASIWSQWSTAPGTRVRAYGFGLWVPLMKHPEATV